MTILASRVINIYNRKTSIRLAHAEWEALDNICETENIPRKTLLELIDLNRDEKLNLTSAIRLFTMIYYKNALLGIKNKGPQNEATSPVFEAIKGIL